MPKKKKNVGEEIAGIVIDNWLESAQGEKQETFSVTLSATLIGQFRKACFERGRKQNWVLSQYMQEFITHPAALSRNEKGGKKNGVKVAEVVSRQGASKGKKLVEGHES